MLPDERVGAELHRLPPQLAGHPPGVAGQERVGDGPVHDRVPVGPPLGRAAGVEAAGDDLARADDDLGGQHPVHRLLQPPGVDTGVAGQADDLAPGVDPGVGPPGAGQLRLVAQDLLERLAQHTGHRPDVGLGGEAVEVGPVVGDDELELGASPGGFGGVPRRGQGARVEQAHADPGGTLDQFDPRHGGVVTRAGAGSRRADRRTGARSRRRAWRPRHDR